GLKKIPPRTLNAGRQVYGRSSTSKPILRCPRLSGSDAPTAPIGRTCLGSRFSDPSGRPGVTMRPDEDGGPDPTPARTNAKEPTKEPRRVLSVAQTSDEPCDLCGGPWEVRYQHIRWCARCVSTFLGGVKRRRDAEKRLPPLAAAA